MDATYPDANELRAILATLPIDDSTAELRAEIEAELDRQRLSQAARERLAERVLDAETR